MNADQRRCGDAIRRMGGDAALLRGERELPFPACIQPRPGDTGEWSDALGIGRAACYTLYAPYGTAADGLQCGDSVRFLEERYLVQRVETQYLGGAPMFRWAVIQKESGS